MSPRLRLSLPTDLFSLGLPIKFLYASLVYPSMKSIPPIYFSLICHPNKIWWRVNLMKLPIMHFSLASFYFLPLRHKYSLIKTRKLSFSERCQTSYGLTFRHRTSCILGQAFHYSPENAFYIFNQQIYFVIWYLLDSASLI